MRVMVKSLVSLLVGVALAGGSLAAELAGRAPLADQAFGQQSDASGPAYTQSFVAPAGSMLEAIRWWGFHSQNSMGPTFDNFVVLLDGVLQTGSLTVASASPLFDEYTLDVPDAALTASTLSVFNDSLDVEWFWQSASAIGNATAPDAVAVAFSLIGRTGDLPVDEPVLPSLIFSAMAALALARRRPAGSSHSQARPNS